MRKNRLLTCITAMMLSLCILCAPVYADSEDVQTGTETQKVDTVYSQPKQSKFVTTKQTAVINGKKIKYNATAGKMLLDNEAGQYEIYFNAYTKRGVKDKSERPITFVFNGGPGSASLWLHIGALGPERVDLDNDGNVKKVPTTTKSNKYSILDLTDLVFIDPVGTGYSHAVGETVDKDFYSFNYDIYSVAEFIRLYITKYDRWASPKYLIGESYGTVRAVGVTQYLQETHYMALNGIILISTVNDYQSVLSSPGNDNCFVNYLPSYAAAAWYHKKLDANYQKMSLEKYLEKVKEFASGEYLAALYKGNRITSKEKKNIAKKLAAFTGLTEEFILKSDLRVDLEPFCKELLSDKKLMIGRMDSRYTGPVTSGSIFSGESDPSSIGVSEAFVSAYINYISTKLGYKTDETYIPLSEEANYYWNFDHDNDIIAQQDDIKDIMSKNPSLKVWVTCGYYDLATPLYAAEWVFSHVDLHKSIKKNLMFTYYKSGHMFYANKNALKQFRKDAEAWYGNN